MNDKQRAVLLRPSTTLKQRCTLTIGKLRGEALIFLAH